MRLLYQRLAYGLQRRLYSQPSTSTVRDLTKREVEGNVKVQGWIKRVERRGEFTFARLFDGATQDEVQLIIPKNVCEYVNKGDAVEISGTWKRSLGRLQAMELYADEYRLHAKDEDASYKNWSVDKLREHIHLRVKAEPYAALLRLRSTLFLESHRFFTDRDYVHIDTPTLTQNDCEGAGELFKVMDIKNPTEEFFSTPTYLTISSQLHLEAMSAGLPRVYTLNKCYRADVQVSTSHLSEFRMLEVETAFCDDIDETCDLVEDYVRHCATRLMEDKQMQEDYRLLGIYSTKEQQEIVLKIAESKKYPRIPYAEAVKLLQADKKWEYARNSMNKKNELHLVKKFGCPVFVTHYPSEQKPFYVARCKDDPTMTLSFDLLAPIVGELAGGTVREQSTEEIVKRGGSDIDWYVELRKRGKPISSGFGVGFERLMQVLLGTKNIRDTLPFPRTYGNCKC